MIVFKEWEEKILVIMRGIPGSGKSTAAKKLAAEAFPDAEIFSTDQFFHVNMDFEQPYVFDFKKLGYFHKKNLDRAIEAMRAGKTVIIDNTNVSTRDADAYIEAAAELGYRVVVKESDTPWKFDVDTLAQKNQHGVPHVAIQRMVDKWALHDDFVGHFRKKYPNLHIS